MIDPYKANFGGTPVAPWRKRLVFEPGEPDAPPVVSIVTPFYSPGLLFRETLESVLGQSLLQWEWLIVDDASPDAESRSILEDLRGFDPRIRILEHDRNRGRSAARNTGIAAAGTEFVFTLDHDDLLEPTALEKTFWCLVSHSEYGFVNGWSVAFGARGYLWNHGFECEDDFLKRNMVSGRALIRRKVLETVGGYDESLLDGYEDWDLWLRCAEQGIWGGTIPEHLDWFRFRDPPADWEDPERAEVFRRKLKSRYPDLFGGIFPSTPGRPSRTPATSDLPCANQLRPVLKRALIVVNSLGDEASGALVHQAVELLARQGWQLTIVAMFAGSGAHLYGRRTSDTHIVDHFLDPADLPRFLHYLIDSRQPEVVLSEHGELGRALVTYLRRICPQPAYLGLSHSDPNESHPGCSPADLAKFQNVLEDLLVTSGAAIGELVNAGADPQRLEHIEPGVDTTVWKPLQTPRGWLRKQWGAEDDETVLLVWGRLSAAKPTNVLARTLLELECRGLPWRAVIIGEGGRRAWLEDFVAGFGLAPRVVFYELAEPSMILKALAAADLFFLPVEEGTAMAALQAMAVGLPVVSADVGGQRELIDAGCGVLIEAGDDRAEVGRYAHALEELILDGDRRRAMASAARRRALASHGADRLHQRLAEIFQSARGCRRARPMLPSRDFAFNRAVECCRGTYESERLRLLRDTLERRAAEQAARLRETQSWARDLDAARSWEEKQRVELEGIAADRARILDEQKSWIDQLADSHSWHDEQNSHWQKLVEQRGYRIERLEAERAWLEERLRSLEESCEAQSQQIGDLEEGLALSEDRLRRLRTKHES